MTQWKTGLFRVVTAIAVVAGVSGLARAQELTGTLDVQVVPERPSYTYRVGEPVTFLIEVRRDGQR
jgi:hypothetical protein